MAEDYIHLISQASDRYGSPYLLGLMDEYGVSCLADIEQEQAKAYYIKYIGGKRNGKQNIERDNPQREPQSL